jgi:hypothetical protein
MTSQPPAATRTEHVLVAVTLVLGAALGVAFLFTPAAEVVTAWLSAVFAPVATAVTWLGDAALGLAHAAWQGALGLLGLA